VTEPRSRRRFCLELARLAGATPAALAVLAGRESAASDATDFAILYAAINLESHAIDLYNRGLERGFFAARRAEQAVVFRGDHLGHRDTQIEIARERGGRVPSEPAPYPYTPADDPTAWIRAAQRVEQAAIDAYTGVLRRIGDRDHRLAAAYILVDEVRHLTAWSAALGARLY
jgi:rubrerythrin